MSEWKITEDDFSDYTLKNVCWQSAPFSLGDDGNCMLLQTSISEYINRIELDPNDFMAKVYLDGFSKNLLSCAKAINNEKLRQVAESYNGKWY